VYDFKLGENITVSGLPRYGRGTKKQTVTGRVVGVYPAFVNIDTGRYIESINFADIHCGHLKLFRVIVSNRKIAV